MHNTKNKTPQNSALFWLECQNYNEHNCNKMKTKFDSDSFIL